MGKKVTRLYQAISSSKLPLGMRFGAVKKIRETGFRVKRAAGRDVQLVCLIMSNEGYGHEYWLKKYSGFQDDICAQIEHGVYFGKNTSPKVNVIAAEHDFRSFITYGNYRKECLSAAYPEARVVEIGPYIQYAETDQSYYQYIKTNQLKGERTLTLFPAHSVRDGKTRFSHMRLIERVVHLAKERDMINLMVCLSPMDISTSLEDLYKNNGFFVVSCGDSPTTFLPRQRAIFENSDLTVSNDLGTHIGYSLAMGTPHLIVEPVSLASKIESSCIAPGINLEQYSRERNHIISAFSLDHEGRCSNEEKENIYEYYWGGSIHRSPEEMKRMLQRIKDEFKSSSL